MMAAEHTKPFLVWRLFILNAQQTNISVTFIKFYAVHFDLCKYCATDQETVIPYTRYYISPAITVYYDLHKIITIRTLDTSSALRFSMAAMEMIVQRLLLLLCPSFWTELSGVMATFWQLSWAVALRLRRGGSRDAAVAIEGQGKEMVTTLEGQDLGGEGKEYHNTCWLASLSFTIMANRFGVWRHGNQ